jgi:hypothetical protein
MAKSLSSAGAQTLELVSWLKENPNPDTNGYEVTPIPPNSRLIVGRTKGAQIQTLTLVGPDGHPGMFSIQPIAVRRASGG